MVRCGMGCCPGPHVLPISIAILTLLSLITAYTISFLKGHIKRQFPYISETGASSPESCIFGELWNTIAVLLGIFYYFISKQVSAYFSEVSTRGTRRLLRMNNVALAFGFLDSFGISVVANFQITNLGYTHYVGAALAYLGLCVNAGINTALSYKMHYFTSRTVCRTRLVATFGMTLLSSITCTTGVLFWTLSYSNYKLHNASTLSQWLMVLMMLVYVLTYVHEFKRMTITPLKMNIRLNGHVYDMNLGSDDESRDSEGSLI
ncbi:DNA damage-regulated autophagy modulator protein 2-like [Tubulanus polymorphus]|uniref:DNA damage-regulated autophagy modulator protein 2-like n=1 Tax=Tubulanus polymorphus TaxID=672921 RepID=UPI003DA5D3D4